MSHYSSDPRKYGDDSGSIPTTKSGNDEVFVTVIIQRSSHGQLIALFGDVTSGVSSKAGSPKSPEPIKFILEMG